MNGRISRSFEDILNRVRSKNAVAITYFNELPNVGDLIGPYLVRKITGREVYLAKTSIFPRLLTVGSVLGAASENSTIWGSGSIDGRPLQNKLDPKRISAVRGKLTLNLIRRTLPVAESVPLGDPALLMPKFFSPAIEKRYDVGIVPHYADFDLVARLSIDGKIDAKILDVRSEPEVFIESMLECRQIISSSLHGLILADAYKIPNMWVKFSDRLVGGKWKFHDYYSVTDEKNPILHEIADLRDLQEAIRIVTSRSEVAEFDGSIDELLEVFPLQRC